MDSVRVETTMAIVVVLFFCISNVTYGARASRHSHALIADDALIAVDAMSEAGDDFSSSAISTAPGYMETSEYLIGKVSVGIAFLESNGTIDPSTEDWTSMEESNVVNKIQTALTWWASQNLAAHVSFEYDIHYRVPTRYEPINRPSTDEGLWISEAVSYLGYPGMSYFAQVRDYVNALRSRLNTSWAFAIFVVDSSNDLDGEFTDGFFAYSYAGGPFLVMTYDNSNWEIEDMDRVTAHEVGHIFYATNEYDGVTQYRGYLNVADVDGSGGIMDGGKDGWYLSSGTRGQVGWRDSDGDGIQDIVDTYPNTTFSAYSPDPTSKATLLYSGVVTEIPYPNRNPKGTGRSVTVNTIVDVEYRVDSGVWLEASVADGSFGEAEEDFSFTTPSLSPGVYFIQTRGKNSVGNIETFFATDTVEVEKDHTPPVTSLTYSTPNHLKDTTLYISQQTVLALSASDDGTGVANTFYKLDSGLWGEYTAQFTMAVSEGVHTIHYYSEDNAGNNETIKTFGFTIDNTSPGLSVVFPTNGSVLNAPSVDISWSGSDDGCGIDHYEIRVDDGSQIEKGLLTNHTLQDISEGDHAVSVKAFDELGNVREDSIVFRVDLSPPLLSVQSQNESRSSSVNVIWSGSDWGSGIDHYKIRLDKDAWIDLGADTTYTFNQLEDGSHVISVEAVDRAGNHQQAVINLLVNTSLIGGPGWLDDLAVFAALVVLALVAGLLLWKKRRV